MRASLFGKLDNKTGSWSQACAFVMAGLEGWQPWGLILDLREIEYEWGDRMEDVVRTAERWYLALGPFRAALCGDEFATIETQIIFSIENEKALRSLVESTDGRENIKFASDLTSAIGAYERKFGTRPTKGVMTPTSAPARTTSNKEVRCPRIDKTSQTTVALSC